MKALSIKNPFAFDILMGQKTTEYRTWLPKDVKRFLLVSSAVPSNYAFGLGEPNGYALAIIDIKRTTSKKNKDGNYAWSVAVSKLIDPFPVKGKLHFYDVPDNLIHPLPELDASLKAFYNDEADPEAQLVIDQYFDPLFQIGFDQMPKKYQKIYDATDGDWEAVAKAWIEAGEIN